MGSGPNTIPWRIRTTASPLLHRHAGRSVTTVSALLLVLLSSPALAGSPLETVSGTGCYRYGDDQTPALAKRAALALAQEQAVRNHHVFVSSSSTVKNFQLEEDVITTASTGLLQRLRADEPVQKGQEICISITAEISPLKLDEVIHQKANAKKIAAAAQMPVLTEGSSFELQLWTNKPAGEAYTEGDELHISVRSNRDAFLKVDYYQADGTVVHLVPNLFVDDAFVRAGKIYTFGDRHSRSGFRITGPFGAETIKAVASTNPFEAPAASKTIEEGQAYLNTFHAQMRGIKVVGTPGQPIQWAEAAFGLTTASKLSLEQHRFLSTLGGRK